MSDNFSDSNEAPNLFNTPSERLCQKCRAILESSHIGEVCPACLMQIGFESEASEKSIDSTENPAGYDASAFTEEDSLEAVQKLFPSLEILELIGRGGMGIVYKARQTHLGRLVALKLLRAKCSGDPSLAERFSREARALAKLSHPNIVGVHDFGQAGDRPYLIMEYIEGVNLRSMLESKTLNPVEAMAMVPAICEALQFAHDEGVVHRDIKPENILVDRRGRVRIADFGLARLMSRSKDEWTLTGTRQVMGTPHYMAPEQIEHPQEVDHRADIYSLGVVIYEMLTGELPIGRFELPSNKINVDIRFDDIVLRTLEKEPIRRYQHVTEVQTAVEKIATNPSLTAPTGYLIREATIDIFLRIAVVGLMAAALVDMGFAIAMFADSFPTFSWSLVLGGTYHATIALILGFSAWQLLNHGSKQWQWSILLAIAPIHFGVLGAWPFAIIYLLLLLIGFRLKSTEQLNDKLASEFPSQSQTLNDGAAVAMSAALKYWKQFSDWLVSNWPVLWRQAFRKSLLVVLWIAFCGMASWSLYWSYGSSRFPTTLRISDYSAIGTVLSTSDDIRLRIESNTTRDHKGHTIRPEDLKRTQVQFSLYLSADRRDLTGNNYGLGSSNKVFLSEAFNAYFTTGNTIEYEILYPTNLHGRKIVEPRVFKSKPAEGLQSNSQGANASVNAPYATNANYFNELDSLQYRPTLNSAKPIEKWLATAGMKEEQATKTAAGLYDLLVNLSETGGMVPNATGDNRLKPISDMLDKETFTPQSPTRISASVTTENWAIDVWVGASIAACLLGIVSFFALKLYQASHSSRTSNSPVSM